MIIVPKIELISLFQINDNIYSIPFFIYIILFDNRNGTEV